MSGRGANGGAGDVVLAVRDVSKSYGAVQALTGVSLEARRGEVLGLVGDNGAGKTTLVKCIAGVLQPDAGEIVVDGVPREEHTAEAARAVGIEVVHQHLSLIDTLDVAENFFLNRELVRSGWVARRFEWMDRRAMYRETAAVLSSLAVDADPYRLAAYLSGGQRQMIAVARAMKWGRHIVIMDEPAAALGVRQAQQILDFVRLLADRGIAVIFISHNMQHVLAATDRIVVLRQGRNVGDVRTRETTGREIVTLITGSDLAVPGQEVGV
jgi:simple sugar transport system ATP-binding protein